jgi:hypothetical protein
MKIPNSQSLIPNAQRSCQLKSLKNINKTKTNKTKIGINPFFSHKCPKTIPFFVRSTFVLPSF